MNKSEEMLAILLKISDKTHFYDLKQGYTGLFESIANSLMVTKYLFLKY